MIFLKIFYNIWLLQKKYQRRKTTGDKILSLANKILATFIGFWPPLPKSATIQLDFGNFRQNLATMAVHRRIPASTRFQRVLPEFGLTNSSESLESNQCRWIPAIGYQNLGTFDG
jgi:hypothetical protein